MKTIFQLIKEDIAIYKNKESVEIKELIHIFNPKIIPVIFYRFSHFFYRIKLGFLGKIISVINFILFGCDIARGAKIDGGLYLPHSSGVVIGEYSIIGKNCIIHQGVTLGDRGDEYSNLNPKIGDCVEICTGAKILGDIKLEDYSVVVANSVVLNDVPYATVVAGVPSKIIKTRKII